MCICKGAKNVKVYYVCMKSIIGLSTVELEVTNSFSGQWTTHIFLSTDDILQPKICEFLLEDFYPFFCQLIISFNVQINIVNSCWKIFTCEASTISFKAVLIWTYVKIYSVSRFWVCWKNYDFKDILWIQVLNFYFLFSLNLFSYLKNWWMCVKHNYF